MARPDALDCSHERWANAPFSYHRIRHRLAMRQQTVCSTPANSIRYRTSTRVVLTSRWPGYGTIPVRRLNIFSLFVLFTNYTRYVDERLCAGDAAKFLDPDSPYISRFLCRRNLDHGRNGSAGRGYFRFGPEETSDARPAPRNGRWAGITLVISVSALQMPVKRFMTIWPCCGLTSGL